MKKSLSRDFVFRYAGRCFQFAGILAALLLSLDPATPLNAATYTWQTGGATNNWSTTGDANWFVDSGTVLSSWGNGNAAVFNNTTDTSITVTGVVAPTSITFGATWANNLTLTGGTIAFGSLLGIIDSSAVGTTNSRVMTIGSNLTGTGGLSINAHGNLTASGGGNSARLVLSGDNSGLSGGIAITGGLVEVTSVNSLGSNAVTLTNGGGILHTVSGALTLANNVVVGSTGGTIRNYGSSTLTLSGTLSGNGALNHTDTGRLILIGNLAGYTGILSNLAGNLVIETNTSVKGEVVVSGGTLSVGNNGNLGSLNEATSITINGTSSLYIRRTDVTSASAILPTSIAFGAAGSVLEYNPTDAAAVLNLDLDIGSSTTLGTFRVSGGTVNMLNGTDVVVNSVIMGLQSATNRGTLNIGAGSSLSTLFFNIGATSSNSGTVNQTGGIVTVLSGSSGFRVGHWSNGSNPGSAYNLSGGVLDATALSANSGSDRFINVGWDGLGTMTVGGGTGTATLKAFGIQLDIRSPDAASVNTLTVLNNGVVEIGAGGTAAGNVTDVIYLSGGSMKATAASTWAATMSTVADTISTVDTNGFQVTVSTSIDGAGRIQVSDSAGGGVLTFSVASGTQTIAAGLTGTGAVSKTGAGTTVFSGTGTYSGTISHTAGTLLVTGNHQSAAINVSDGAVFGGEGSIGSLVMGSVAGTVFQVNPVTGGALSVTGDVAFNGTVSLEFAVPATVVGQPIKLFTYGGTLTGLGNLTFAGQQNYRSFSLVDALGTVTMDLGTKTLLWNGTSGGQWQVGGGVNRWNASEADAFYWGDVVTFDETGTTTDIVLTGELRPASVIVNSNSKNYTFTGGTGNFISGITTVLKSGTSTATFTGPNTYTGGTLIRQGRVVARSATALGAGTVTLGDGSTTAGALELFIDPMGAGSNITFANAINIGPVTAGTTAVIGTLGSTVNVVTRSGAFSGPITLNDDVILRSGAHDSTTFSGAITGAAGLTITVENGLVQPANVTSTLVGKGQAGNRVILSGDANGFVGNWVIKSGTSDNYTLLQINTGNRINDSSNVHIEEFAVLRLNAAESINALTGNGRVRGAVSSRTLTVGAGNGSGTFSGVLENDTFDAGTLALTKSGTGTQILTGVNTYTGITTVTGGALEVSVLANGGVASSIGMSGSAATNLVLNGGVLRYAGSASIAIDRLFTVGTAGGGIESSGAGTLTLSALDAITLSGTDTARTFTLGGSNTGANTFAGVIGNNGTGATSLSKTGAGTWVLTGANVYTGAVTVSGGTLAVGDGGTTGTLGGTNAITVSAGGTLVYNRSDLVTLDRAFATGSSGTLIKNGAGNMTISAFTLLPTSFIVNSGVVTVNGGSFGGNRLEGNGTITINAGGSLVLASTHALGGSNGGMSDSVVVNGGLLTINEEQYFNNLTLQNGGNVNGIDEVRASNATNWQVTGSSETASVISTLVSHVAAANWTVQDITGNSDADLVISGRITSSGSLNKGGAGTMELSNDANSYSGGTNINAGTLLVNTLTGSATGMGQVTIAAGATLAGRGAVNTTNANITINGTLSVGNSGDDLFTSDLNLHLGTGTGVVIFNGVLVFDIFGQEDDTLGSEHGQLYGDVLKFNATGSVQLGGTLKVNDATADALNWNEGDSWQLIDWTNVAVGGITGSFSNFELPTLADGLKWDTSLLAETGVISVTVVPEPGRMVLLSLACGLALVRRKRKVNTPTGSVASRG